MRCAAVHKANWAKTAFRNGPLGVKSPKLYLAASLTLSSVVGTQAATSCHQNGADEPI